MEHRYITGDRLAFEPVASSIEASAPFPAIDFEHYQKVFDSFTDEHKERLAAYRSGDYYP